MTADKSVLLCFLLVAGVVSLMDAAADGLTQVMRPERWVRGDLHAHIVQPIDTAAWIAPADTSHEFYRFRRAFTATAGTLRFDVSADERFILLLDGRVVARGPHRGLKTRWYYQTYDVPLTAGEHVFEAIVMKLGDHSPHAQVSRCGGSFVFKAEGAYDALLTTGKAEWQVGALANTRMTDKGTSRSFAVGDQCAINGTSFLYETPKRYDVAKVVSAPVRNTWGYGHRESWPLYPTERPDQLSTPCSPGVVRAVHDDAALDGVWSQDDTANPFCAAVTALLQGKKNLTVPAGKALRILWDLDDYYCGYPELTVSGGKGGRVRWGWTESLREAHAVQGNLSKGFEAVRETKDAKNNRDAFIGKRATQLMTDTLNCDGRDNARLDAPWWRCGRWCVLSVEAGETPLTLTSLQFVETRYPLAFESSFTCSDPFFVPLAKLCRRTVAACTHEMLFDCPYYEQQMYPGDTRIQLLIHAALTRDDRMARYAMMVYDFDRRTDGMVAMNAPTWGLQESTTYTLCWVLMFRDYLYWHDNAAWLRTRLPGLRHTLSNLLLYENAQGLLENLPGWSFIDWADEFRGGVPPGGLKGEGMSSPVNLFYVLALQSAAEVERVLGENAFADVWQAHADRAAQAIRAQFWDGTKNLIANTPAKDSFCEHAQTLGTLTGILTPDEARAAIAAVETQKLHARCSPYFAHYLFEAYTQIGRTDLLLKHLEDWKRFLTWGARTAFETQLIDARSDCHAWSACPEYHCQASLAGVRPAAPFFARVRIAPQPASLTWLKAKTPSPHGMIETDLQFEKGGVRGTVTLPGKLAGTFVWQKREIPLVPGNNKIALAGLQ